MDDPRGELLVVGRVDASSARIWFRSAEPGAFVVCWAPEKSPGSERHVHAEVVPENDSDNTCSVRIGANGVRGAELSPDTRYRVRVLRTTSRPGASRPEPRRPEASRPHAPALDAGPGDASAHELGRGSFTTAPADSSATDRLAFMIGSCHQPFRSNGSIDPDARNMLRAVNALIDEKDPRFLLAMGDQVYTDYPKALSLFEPTHFRKVAPAGRSSLCECTPGEVRGLLHARYRHWWDLPEWRSIVSRLACYPMWDDHEIIDNWGSASDHAAPEWQSVFEGARRAFADYQGAWISTPSEMADGFDFDFEHGPIAVYGLDIRTYRTPGEEGRLYTERQLSRFEAFLERMRHKELIFVVLSVPIVHLPRTAATLIAQLAAWNEDFSDRWSTQGHVRDRDRFLELLREHQRRHQAQRVVLLSGDIHLGCAHRIVWDHEGGAFHQLVSSGLSHGIGPVMGLLARLSIRFNREICTADGQVSACVEPLPSRPGRHRNPYAGRNCGIVELARAHPGAPLRARYEIYGHSGPRPRCVYASEWF